MCSRQLIEVYLHGLHESDAESHHRGQHSLTQAVIGPPKLGWTAEHVQAWGMDEWFDFQDHDVRFCSVDYRPPLMRSFLEVGEREF
jgi:hypothetical protein